MQRKGTWPLAMALMFVGSGAAVAQEGTQERGGDLRWDLEAGEELSYAYTWVLEQTMEVKGMTPPQTQVYEISYNLDQEVQKVEEGVATIQATISSIQMKLGLGMMGELAYDSAHDEEGNPMRAVRHVVGKQFTYTMTPRGEVTSVTGGDQLRDEVIEAARDEMADRPAPKGGMGGGGMGGMGGMMDPSAMAEQLVGQLTTIFTNEMLRTSLEVVNDVLPEGAQAAEGDTWSRRVVEEVPQLGTLSYDATLTHRGAAEGNVRITSSPDGEVSLERAEPAEVEGGGGMQEMARKMQQEMLKNMEVVGTSARGTSTFSTRAGRLLDSEIVQEIETEGPLPEMMKAMMGQKKAEGMKMEQAVVITMRYVQLDAPAGEGEGQKEDGASF